jgi:phage baseplate assembly protein V
MMLVRGVLHLVDSGQDIQTLQARFLVDELLDRKEHFEAYGFTSNPLPGAEVLAASLGGRRAHTIIFMAADRRYRKKNLASGEVALHNHLGDYIYLKNGRIIEVVAGTKLKVTAPEVEFIAGTKVRHDTPLTELTGDLEVAGDAVVDGNTDIGGDVTVGGSIDVVDDINTSEQYHVDGVQVVGPRGAAVADAAATVASCQAAINAWLARARAHGLIAP